MHSRTGVLSALLAAMLIWLPFSQATALCCAESALPAAGSPTQDLSAEPCHEGQTPASDAVTAEHDDSCFSGCLLLVHAPLPASGHPTSPAASLAVAPAANPASLQPAHRLPLLRPPALSHS